MKAFGGNGTSSPVDKGRTEHVESAAGTYAKPTRWQKIKRHYKKWWWAHLIVSCAAFLIIALCLVYVAMPKIAQDAVNAASLSFASMKFTNPTEEFLTLSVDAVQHSSSIFTPTIDAFNVTMHLVTDGISAVEPITQIPMPEIHVQKPDTKIGVDGQQVRILDFDQVAAFAIQLLNQPNVTVRMVGSSKLHEGALPVINIKYNSSITFDGLNGLPGFNMIDPKVNLSAPAGQPNMMGTALIPNPTIVTVEMGNVTLDISTKEAGLIGNTTVTNFTLKPGENKLPMSAIVDSGLAIKSMKPNGMLDLLIVGKTSVYNGVHLPYYEKALQSHTLKVSINLTEIVANSL